MKTQLWTTLLQFDLDYPISEYGFSTRLASENNWTKNFTAQAILEYKKFMYLAATSDSMVSPSEIVDKVWHQHLIFTQSYNDFCSLLGKWIEHIPSTHNKEDFEKFRVAKEQTIQLYNNTFGVQPAEIWHFPDMLASLQLSPARLTIGKILFLGLLMFPFLLIPLYFLLNPLYAQIDNPYFLYGYIALVIFTLIKLTIYNKAYLKNMVKNWPPYSFVYQLQPAELVYLRSGRLSDIVHGYINKLIDENKIGITDKNSLQLNNSITPESAEEQLIFNQIEQSGTLKYTELLKQLVQNPLFKNIAVSMNAFRKHIYHSKAFGELFYVNMGILFLLLMLGLVRVMTGYINDKPINNLVFVVTIFTLFIFFFLVYLHRQIHFFTIPKLYKTEILPEKENTNTWDWQYFLLGSAVFSPAFIPLVDQTNKNNESAFSSSSDSSSCGSSCGGGCGGCGGGD